MYKKELDLIWFCLIIDWSTFILDLFYFIIDTPNVKILIETKDKAQKGIDLMHRI